MRIAFVISLILTHLLAFMFGRDDMKDNTIVRDIYPNGNFNVSLTYFGKCLAPDMRICGIR